VVLPCDRAAAGHWFLTGEIATMHVSRLGVAACALLFAAGLVCGCATGTKPDYTRYVQEFEKRQQKSADGAEQPDSPDTPVAAASRPSAKGPAAAASAIGKADITIQPDALVQVRVEEDPALNGSYPVNNIGAIQLGYVGPVILYNRTEPQAAQKIAEVLKSRDFRNATVTVRILRASYDKISVQGAVNTPGVIKIGAGDIVSLNDALLRAGGLLASVRGARVKIVRDGLRTAVAPALKGEEFALVTEEGRPSIPDVWLRNNDVVFVFSREEDARVEVAEKSVLVLGEVSKEGLYHFTGAEPTTIMHLLFKMGGLPPYANDKAIRVIRRDGDGNEFEHVVNVRRIMERGDPNQDFPLENGDRVIVPGRKLSLF
jgi:polysaccharide export outer membrane protein